MSQDPQAIDGLGEIIAAHDLFLVDQYGVLHDGRKSFPTAIDAMRRFRQTRGPVVLLSNAPRPEEGVRAQFDRLSMPHDFYDAIVTSGGAARDDLKRRTSGGQTLALFYLGPERDHPLFEGLDIRLTGADEAEAVLCTGFYDDETETPEDYRALLQDFKARRLPFLCANPDMVVQRGDKLIYCAGAIARLYESLGGESVYYGKPHAAVFEAALAQARAKANVTRPLVIGDGLETDVLGANRLGLDVLFIAGGIHGSEVARAPDAFGSVIRTLFAASGVAALAVMHRLSW